MGTCRREDIFVTTPNNEPIEELRIIDFEITKTKEMIELENYYNNEKLKNDSVDVVLNNFTSMIKNNLESQDNIENNSFITDAFENEVDQIKTVKDLNIGDMI